MSEVLLYLSSTVGEPAAVGADGLTARRYVGVAPSGQVGGTAPVREHPTGEHLLLAHGERGSSSIAVGAAAPGEVRRVYAERRASTADGADGAEFGSPYVMATWWSVTDDGREQFDEWYEQEHVPLLLRVPGRRGITRYALVEGDGPRHFATHELDSLEVLSHPLERAAAGTPWRERATAARRDFERRLYRRSDLAGPGLVQP